MRLSEYWLTNSPLKSSVKEMPFGAGSLRQHGLFGRVLVDPYDPAPGLRCRAIMAGAGNEQVSGLVEGQIICLHRSALDVAREERLRIGALSRHAFDLAGEVGQVEPSVRRAQLGRGRQCAVVRRAGELGHSKRLGSS